jgi:pectinesterase
MRLQTLIAGLLLLLTAGEVAAQLLAFPGAEGVARHITGGRGGDVYKVTNLNDSGPGSLRNGLQTSPTLGRTIVFDVAGTIQLNSSLDITRDNITIAGQTAPAGGITLAGHRLRVSDAENVVVQFLRVRPGYNNTGADPDAIWVSGSTGVMLDHITASWGVDETVSTTHNSNNVTVQWSTISQALYTGGHSEGDGHSYGSLINGGAYSYHHNLYAHNKSRNPRAQSSGNYLRLDFVNNVMFNPQDRFGYNDSDDPYDMNMVGNYAIKGPQVRIEQLSLRFQRR